MGLVGNGMRIPIWIFTALTAAQLFTVATARAQTGAEAGQATYDEHCAECHGENLRSGGAIPDLRQLRPEQREYFNQTVTDGRGQMPAWGGVLSNNDFDNLWAYIRAHAR
jgi:mono/diheme cytochrome c family protein